MAKTPQPPSKGDDSPAKRRAPRTRKAPAASKVKATAKAKLKTQAKPRAKTKPKATWLRKFLFFSLKFSAGCLALLAIYLVYLDSQIAQKFEGQRWHLPAQVFARPMNLYPDAPITHKQLKQELTLLGYRNTGKVNAEGEFGVSKTRIELYRRGFDGPDGYQIGTKLMVHFRDNRVEKITNSQNRELGFMQLEPLLLERLMAGGHEDRLFVPREEVPEFLISVLLQTEDKEFYHHHGVSITGIVRALIVNLKAGRTVQGGSTLTQQLAKNFFLSNERTVIRKINDVLMALIIDARYSKDAILEAYLNEVYMGQDGGIAIHGVGLAARHYFGTPLNELDLGQQALLVALIKGPSYYNPWRYPERAKTRRDLVLRTMVNQGRLDGEHYHKFAGRSLALKDPNWRQRHRIPAFRSMMTRELSERYGDEVLASSGLRIYTTLDPLAQRAAEQAVHDGMQALSKAKKDDALQAAMVVVDRHHGGVLALVGDKEPSFSGFNRALDAKRPIGSLVKPLIVNAALTMPQQYHLATPLKDEPIRLISDGGQSWTPNNADKQFRGQVSLIDSLVHSYNIPTVNLGMSVGLDAVTGLLYKAGWQERIEANPALLLGALESSPVQMAQLYQTLADGGRYRPLYTIGSVLNAQGDKLLEASRTSKQVLSPKATWLTNYAMTQVVERGTANRLHNQFRNVSLAGKTGTSSDGRDAWYAGFDDRDVVVTWVGRDDNGSTNLAGGSAALPLYQRYLQQRDPLSLVMTRPSGIVNARFRLASGQAVAADCADALRLPADQISWSAPADCNKVQVKKTNNWIKDLFNF